jgi:hypothetical protein
MLKDPSILKHELIAPKQRCGGASPARVVLHAAARAADSTAERFMGFGFIAEVSHFRRPKAKRRAVR